MAGRIVRRSILALVTSASLSMGAAWSAAAQAPAPPPAAPPEQQTAEEVEAQMAMRIGDLEHALGQTQLELARAHKEIFKLRAEMPPPPAPPAPPAPPPPAAPVSKP